MKSNVVPIFGASNIAPETDGIIIEACLLGAIKDFGARNLALSLVDSSEQDRQQAA